MWSRLPVGRPHVLQQAPWDDHGNPHLARTVAYLWDTVSPPYATTARAYLDYMNEIDALVPSTVEWEPYNSEEVLAMPLNPMCRRDQDLWRMRCPLICFYAVEIHLPHRVERQFGFAQMFPPEEVSTSIVLHKFDRVKQRKVTDFVDYHRERIEWWNRMEANVLPIEGPHNNANFRAYLTWYHCATHYRLCQRWTQDDYADIDSSDDENTTYDVRGREGRAVELAPILDRVGTSMRDSVCEIDAALEYPVGHPETEGRFRTLLQRLRRRLSRAAARAGCRTLAQADVSVPGTSHAARSSSSHQAAATRSSSRAATFSDDEDDDDDDDGSGSQGDEQEELRGSQLEDAPPATQPTQRRRQAPIRLTPGTDALGKARGKRKAKGG